MPNLKRITVHSVPAALDKALRYRLLNEPEVAESICRDVLAVDENNHEALVTLLLALTDQFHDESVSALEQAKEVLAQLPTAYDLAYYEGIIHERWARAEAARHVPTHVVDAWHLQAMRCFERAQQLAAPDNPDPILRFNTCARLLAHGQGQTGRGDVHRDVQTEFGDEVPPQA